MWLGVPYRGINHKEEVTVYKTLPTRLETVMHTTALQNCKQFFDTYAKDFPAGAKVIEIGSQDVNGSLRSVTPGHFDYLGVDFVAGKGVDLVLSDPYQLPLETGSADIVVSSSCFEHSEMFWLVYLEIMRILKPHGLFYLNVPSNGAFHRYPVDCWRFYPDSGRALVTWAKRNGMNAALLESFTSLQSKEDWNDFVAVFVKDAEQAGAFPNRIVQTFSDFDNAVVHGHDGIVNHNAMTENQRKFMAIAQIAVQQLRVR